MSERVPAIKVRTIFGSVILAHIDPASAVAARRSAPLRWQPVAKNDGLRGQRVTVTEADVVLMAIGADGHPTPSSAS